MRHDMTISAKPHYDLLDGLRGVAAILVLFYHVFEGFAFAEATNGVGSGIITTLNHAHIAVDFFFILSGFVISYAYDNRWGQMSMGQFFKRRLIRLHPMYVMGAVMGFAAFAFVGFERWDGTMAPTGWVMMALLLTIFMIPAVPGLPYEVRGNGEMFPLNGPAWSLFFEYVGNILYALFIRRLSIKRLAALTLVLGALHAWFFVGDISGYGMLGVGWTIDEVNFWGGLLRMLFPFTLGMLISRTFKPMKVKGAFWICSVVLIVLVSVPYIESAGGVVNLNCLYEYVCVALIFPLLVWLGACGSTTEGGKATHRIYQALGDLSYPLYIVHYPIMYIFYAWLIDKQIYSLSHCLGVATLVVVSSILLAILCLKFYDEPLRRKWAHSSGGNSESAGKS